MEQKNVNWGGKARNTSSNVMQLVIGMKKSRVKVFETRGGRTQCLMVGKKEPVVGENSYH